MTSLISDPQTAGCTELNKITAKDSFLKNSDLMAMTFSYLQVENNKESRSLLNAALTCKDILEVALDALWENLYSLVPLLKILPSLQVVGDVYVCANFHVFIYVFICLQVLSEDPSQADWDRMKYYSRKVKSFIAIDTAAGDDSRVHPSLLTYFRIAQLQSSESPLFPSIRHFHCNLGNRSIDPIHVLLFLSPRLHSLTLHNFGGIENKIVGPFLAFLATLSSQMLSRIVLHSGRMSGDIVKNSFVHFKQLRSLELVDAVLTSDFTIWEVLGTLPSLVNLTLKVTDYASHPPHDAENSNRQSGGPKYFDALESLCVTGSLFLVQHLLGFIDSPCLTTIKVYPVLDDEYEHEPDNHFTPSMTIIASKWPQSLKNLVIDSSSCDPVHIYAISDCLMSLTALHELQTFHLVWTMKNMDDNVRRLVVSWPKLRTLRLPLNHTAALISLSTLRIIAESCSELRHLTTGLDTSTFPPFDTSSKSLQHNLEDLTVGKLHSSITPSQKSNLTCQIRVTQHLDLIFPYLKIRMQGNSMNRVWSKIRDLIQLCQDARRVTK